MKLSYSDDNLTLDISSGRDVNPEYLPKENSRIPVQIEANGSIDRDFLSIISNVAGRLGMALPSLARDLSAFDNDGLGNEDSFPETPEAVDTALGLLAIPRLTFFDFVERLESATSLAETQSILADFKRKNPYLRYAAPDPG